MKNLYKFLFFFGLVAVSGCNRYLDIAPKGYTLLTNVSQYNDWLNATAIAADNAAVSMIYLTDCIDLPKIAPKTTAASDLIYLWAPQFSADPTANARFWPDLYNQIYYFNTVLNGVNDAAGGSESQKKSLRAEALLGRAYSYVYLINLYGKSYDPATADKDLAVPFMTSNDISEAVPPRSTVKELYEQIISDINTALPDLPVSNVQNRYRGSVAAAYSVLARIYLYRRDYAEAARNAHKALNADGSLRMLDFNVYNTLPLTVLPNQSKSPDAIYSRALATSASYNGVTSSTPSLPYLQSFDSTDLRLKFYYVSVVNGTQQPTLNYNYSLANRGTALYTVWAGSTSAADLYIHNCGTTVTEMKLIIAEDAVRRNDLITALQQLNDVLRCRMKASSFQTVVSADSAVVLQKVLLERWHEFGLNGGLRWLDMRRLDAENAMPAVNRYSEGNAVISTLSPHSPRYTLQIPERVLFFNPGMPQNP